MIDAILVILVIQLMHVCLDMIASFDIRFPNQLISTPRSSPTVIERPEFESFFLGQFSERGSNPAYSFGRWGWCIGSIWFSYCWNPMR